MHLILLLFFTLLPDVDSDSLSSDDCARMEVKYEITTLNENENVKIELSVKGGTEPYYYFFFDTKNNPLSWDFKRSYYIVEKSAYPKYVKVLDAEGCTKTIEFNESANR